MRNLSKGKELEDLCLYRLGKEDERGVAQGGRYGVQAVFDGVDATGRPKWMTIPSYPDIEGVLRGGRQFIFDAKVCSQSSLNLAGDHFRDRQFSHLKKRSRMGVVTFLLIHFNARELKKIHDAAVTWAFPVHHEMEFWLEFEAGAMRSISRDSCDKYAEQVSWSVMDRCRKESPDIVDVVRRLSHRFDLPHGYEYGIHATVPVVRQT